MGRERRRRTRRSTSATPPGPAAGTTSTPPVPGATVPPPASRPAVATAPVQVRSDRVLAREATTMMSEIKRVALVSGVCFGMLAVLVVVDRLQ